MVNSSGSVQGHRQDSVRSLSLKDKPVRREKRNINASIFDESDDEADTAVGQMLPHMYKPPDLPKTVVSCECLCEQCASSESSQESSSAEAHMRYMVLYWSLLRNSRLLFVHMHSYHGLLVVVGT